MFRDRHDAGERLAKALAEFKEKPCVVLALPRGGVPVAAEVAAALNAPLDLVVVRKIGAPFQPELAMGAIADAGEAVVVRNDDLLEELGITDRQFKQICAREHAEIERRNLLYLAGRTPYEVKNRIAIVVDDGIATGATMRAALRATRKRHPKLLVMAVPVAALDSLESLRTETDRVVCLEAPASLGAVGAFYRVFGQTSDDEVIALLARANERLNPPGKGAAVM